MLLLKCILKSPTLFGDMEYFDISFEEIGDAPYTRVQFQSVKKELADQFKFAENYLVEFIFKELG